MSDASTVGSNLMTTGCSTTTVTTTTTSSSSSGGVSSSGAGNTKPSGTGSAVDKKKEPWEESKLDDLEDNQLKDLLEEAYSYKNPRDKENKSEAFLQLLQKAENEKEDPPFAFHAITSRFASGGAPSSSSQKHGGSLQDLIEAVHNDSFLDYDYSCNTRIRRNNNHNSRPKKYSSVSSRQREGGSLPSNVNVSNCSLSVYDQQPFLNEVNSKRRVGKNERTCSGTSCASVTSQTSSTVSTCGHDSMNSSSGKDDSGFSSSVGGSGGAGGNSGNCSSAADTVIDMGDNFDEEQQHILARDSLSQGTNGPNLTDGGIELDTVPPIKKSPRVAIVAGYQGKIERTHSEQKSYVDDGVTFLRLERGKNAVDNCSIPLDDFKSCQSILGDKAEMIKSQSALFSTTKTIPKQFDENGNALSSTYNTSQSQAKAKKKKPPQSERNTKTYIVGEGPGYRGCDAVEELVKYIENTEDTKCNEKISKFDNNNKKKEKKKDKESKNKMKKSNSLEELRSCTKLDEDEKTTNGDSNNVTLRSKGKKSKDDLQSKDVVVKITNTANNRKNERRSWGTEELSYLEANATEEKAKKSNKNKKKDDIASIESESAEFHVVTKKRKPKKRQSVDEVKSNFANSTKSKEYTSSHRKFHNDREVLIAAKSRRKSTSSVPPSEKSDSSDEDSVHSLPIESTGGLQPQSYADIARTVNKFGKVILSPTASNSNSPPHMDRKSTQRKAVKLDFPELIAIDATVAADTAVAVKQITYSQSLATAEAVVAVESTTTANNNISSPSQSSSTATDDVTITTITAAAAITTKQTLQKSKSMDHEIEYPALEKTVKRHAMATSTFSNPANDLLLAVANNLDMNLSNLVSTSSSSTAAATDTQTPSICTNSSSSNNHLSNNNNSNSLSCNNSKKSKPSSTSSSSANYHAKGKESNTAATNTTTTATAINNNTNTNNNTNKKSTNPFGILTSRKSSKKEKGSTNSTAVASLSSAAALSGHCNSKSSTNHRPAVIILNDDAAGVLALGSEFTFGDFNEDEMKFFDDDCNGNVIDDSSSDIHSSSLYNDDALNSSPNTTQDHGYSSSTNQSIDYQASTPAEAHQQVSEDVEEMGAPAVATTTTTTDSTSQTDMLNNNQSTSSSTSSLSSVDNNQSQTGPTCPIKMLTTAASSKLSNLSILARSNKLVTCDELESSLTAAAAAAIKNNNGLRPGKAIYKGGDGNLQQQRKDIDVRFIPPTGVASINSDRIIDFIGSAWEEVTNSAVTQFYDDK